MALHQDLRDMELIRKALAIAIEVIDALPPGPFKCDSDMMDMKLLLDRLTGSEVELAYYQRSARIAITGKPPA